MTTLVLTGLALAVLFVIRRIYTWQREQAEQSELNASLLLEQAMVTLAAQQAGKQQGTVGGTNDQQPEELDIAAALEKVASSLEKETKTP